jgi:hypothetical protein
MIDINKNNRVSIDENGILTIHTDNATWVHGDVTTEIKGDYVISSDALNKLMVLMTENPMMLCYAHTAWHAHDYTPMVYNKLITTDKGIAEEIEKMNIAYKKAHDELEVVKRERDLEKSKRVSFEKKIEEFNKTRHWWERKLE